MGPRFVRLPSLHVTVSKARPLTQSAKRATRKVQYVRKCVGFRSIYMCYGIRQFVSVYASMSMAFRSRATNTAVAVARSSHHVNTS